MKKVNKLRVNLLIIVGILSIIIISCSKRTENKSIPELSTNSVSEILITSAKSGGTVINNGGDLITSRGLCWSISQMPTVSENKTQDGTGDGVFVSNMTGLNAGTVYYIRAYATNTTGTGYGNQISFNTLTPSIGPTITFNSTLTYGSISDINGNNYKTIQIGTQIWMAENLKTTKYNDGTAIVNVIDNVDWSNLNTGAYCWHNNNTSSYSILYNWYSVNSGKLCPTGFHIPSTNEWNTLSTYLGGEIVAGGKLKEIGISNWNSPNADATNQSGFTALPGGSRGNGGGYYGINDGGYWWSSAESTAATAWSRFMYFGHAEVRRVEYSKKGGFSVRCIKD